MAVAPVPPSLTPAFRRLSRRLAIGLFLDAWPRWAAGTLLAAGCIALACRLFLPAAASYLYWLFAVPALSTIPAIVTTVRGAYRPEQVIALADSLTGGGGLVLTAAERQEGSWEHAPQMVRASRLRGPRLRPWRRLATVVPALAFLLMALMLPQRTPAFGSSALADQIAEDLSARLADLQARQEVTAEEAEQLEREIADVRRAARERMDAATWEAADAVNERLAAKSAARRDAAQWAQEALARYSAAGGLDPSSAEAASAQAELSRALGALAATGGLAGAPADVQKLLGADGALPTDAASLAQLAAALEAYIGQPGRGGTLQVLGDGMTRFDPSEFGTEVAAAFAGSTHGRGAVTRGRADADLTWGEETRPAERFRAQALPPGFVRSPDDWAPLVSLPGAPEAAPEEGRRSAARAYRDEAGQAAWRRTLAPRHQSAVKKYFQP
jgi:hypothetical protein